MKRWIVGAVAGVMVLLGMTAPVAAVSIKDVLSGNKSICDDATIEAIDKGLLEAAGCTISEEKTVVPVAIGLIQVVLAVIGLVAVAVIIYGGITYSISLGDAAKVFRAKNIVLYGLVGLFVSLFAFLIVTFVSQSIWG